MSQSFSKDTVTRFNGILLKFAEELGKAFPETQHYYRKIQMSTYVDPSTWITEFSRASRGLGDLVRNMDERFFDVVDADSVDIMKRYYSVSSPQTKECIWKYIQVLWSIASSCS